MGIDTEKYIRKPLYVDAVRVTAQNFDEIVAWCQGEVQTDEVPGSGATKKYIKVRVHNPKNPRQTKAFVGDWLLYTERGYKVYTNKAFRAAFDPVLPEKSVPDAGNGEVKEPGLQRAALESGHPIDPAETKYHKPELVATTPQNVADGKRVLSEQEQREMTGEEVRELIRSGDAVLAQDMV